MKYIKAIRIGNILLPIYTILLLKYFFLQTLDIPTFLDDTQFFIYLFSITLINISGSIIGHTYSLDAGENTKLRQGKLFNIYMYINILGLILGFYISYKTEHLNFAFVYVACSILYYQYAENFNKSFIINELVYPFLTAVSVFSLCLFDLLPAINDDNVNIVFQSFKIISFYAIFIFVMTYIIELTNGLIYTDSKREYLAKIIKEKNMRKIITLISLVVLASIFYVSISFLSTQIYSISYIMFFVELPLLYFSVKIIFPKSRDIDMKLNTLLKTTLFLGISSILVFTTILKLMYGNL